MQKLRITTDRHGIDLVSDRGNVAHMTAGYGHTQEQDAADILRAVNCHADLLEALERAELTLSVIADSPVKPVGQGVLMAIAERDRVRAALAKAKGGA